VVEAAHWSSAHAPGSPGGREDVLSATLHAIALAACTSGLEKSMGFCECSRSDHLALRAVSELRNNALA
jgi:hypothetical protein